ncbi:hypothetical protein CJP74_03380 [Psittacicella melopsittaci]|uniref:Protein-export protein SecB n=1 Tax=Psittacicella melopsittaci TaxID=2028576 RepID=A0A3A1Y6C8_9GAMM|nr:protein-export chaperone SecB [Psittacicella melopsittaci]RIY32840.1 hypothetical protein CJP74_03380 [Psittacicella melopsittaci]
MSEQEQKFNRILSIRLVDASFESPNKMALQGRDGVPHVTVKVDPVSTAKVNDQGVYTVSLGVNVTCDLEDKTNVFIVEAKEVATVSIADENDVNSQIFLNGTVPDVLYNSLRELCNDLIVSGGFPEFHLQFVSYEQQYLLDNAERLKLQVNN